MLFGALSALVAPAKEEKMAKPGVEPVRIRMLIVEVRGGTETGLAVEGVGVGPIDHQLIHTPAQEIEDGGLEFAMSHGGIFRGGGTPIKEPISYQQAEER